MFDEQRTPVSGGLDDPSAQHSSLLLLLVVVVVVGVLGSEVWRWRDSDARMRRFIEATWLFSFSEISG